MSAPQRKVVTFLAERRVCSEEFKTLYQTAKKLTDETAAYLNGQGKEDLAALHGSAKYAYANEKMKLSKRLERFADWLILHQSVAVGERTIEDCIARDVRVHLDPRLTATIRVDLPEKLRDLMSRANAIGHDINRLDNVLHPKTGGWIS